MGKETIEQLIQKKRNEMMGVESEMTIQTIYSDIRSLAQNLTFDSSGVARKISCEPLFKMGEKDFVASLYREFLQREPDTDGYLYNLRLLQGGICTRAQMIENFTHTDEAQGECFELIGFEEQKAKEAKRKKLKSITGVGYLGRWLTNNVFLSRRMASLYHTNDVLSIQVDALKRECEELKQQCATSQWHCQVLAEKCESLLQEQRESRKITGELGLVAEQYKKQYKQYCEERETFLQQRQKEEEEKQNREQEQRESERQNKELCDTFYLHYNEKLMPDSREEVKQRALPYIERIRKWYQDTGRTEGTAKFVDLGCGECEWIELLSENGFDAVGIDSNDAVVEKVRRELPNINIVLEDSLQYLKQCEDNSIDLISSFHMVEHMDFLTIITLLKECYRVLKKDGMLIVETPNPQNILTSSYYFYMDPTHIKPIPPELMMFFVEESGFAVREKLLLNPLNFEPYEYKEDDPIKDIVFRFNMEQAYSIMAVKQ